MSEGTLNQLTYSIPLRVSQTYSGMFTEYIENDAVFQEIMTHGKGIPVMRAPSDNMIPDMHNCVGFVTSVRSNNASVVPVQQHLGITDENKSIFGIKPHMLIDGKNQKIVRITEFVLCVND